MQKSNSSHEKSRSARDVFSISGKRTVITGGTAGIGLAVAAHFVEAGAEVVITGRRGDGESVATAMGSSFIQMDVTDDASVRDGLSSAVELLGGIDVLILNAGVDLTVGTVDDLDLAAFRRVQDVNVGGVIRGLAFGTPYLGRGASVVISSSPAGRVTSAGLSAYSASKAAVDSLVKTAAIELAPKGVRVNAVLPGIVKSEMSGGATGNAEVITMITATGVFRDADELAGTYHFLASRASSPLTGATIQADDGISAGLSSILMRHAVVGLNSPVDGADSE